MSINLDLEIIPIVSRPPGHILTLPSGGDFYCPSLCEQVIISFGRLQKRFGSESFPWIKKGKPV